MTTTDDALEQQLRDDLRAVAAAASPPPGLVERLHGAAHDAPVPGAWTPVPRATGRMPTGSGPATRGVRTPRRSPPWAVAAVVALLAVGAGAVAVTRDRRDVPAPPSPAGTPVPSSTSDAPVPWSAAGGQPTTTPAPPPGVSPSDPGTRGCVSDDFRLVSGSSATRPIDDGWMVTTYRLVSVASSPCAAGVLPVVLVDAQGTPLPVDATPSGGPPRFGQPPRVDPGDLVTGTASWAVVQGATHPPADLVVLPDSLVATPRTRPALSISLSGVTVPPHPRNPSVGSGLRWRSTAYGDQATVSRPGSLGSLAVVVTAPASPRVGERLRYTVELRNPADDPVSLAPCPEVVQVVSVVPQKEAVSAGLRGPLNCAAAPRSIPARGAVAFRMELPTDGLVAGTGYLTWQLVAEAGTALDVRVELTVRP